MTKITNKGLSLSSEIHKDSFIEEGVILGKGVVIKKNSYIARGTIIYGNTIINENTYIGENCIIGHPQRDLLKKTVQNKQPATEIIGPSVIIGQNCTIRAGSIIYSDVIIGDNCQTGHFVMIREKTRVSEHSLIGTNCVIDGNVTIGKHVSIQTGVYIPTNTAIGNYVFMGPYSKITNDKYMYRKKCEIKGAIIEDYVSLGANSVIMPSVTLKKNTIIGAGAVVTKDSEEKDILVGNPAKFLKKIPDDWENLLK